MFGGYFPETFDFFRGLQKNNTKKWFDKHRMDYDKYLLDPSKEFVYAIQKFFQIVNPAIVAEPKFNKSFVRINKDMRFAKKPYKDYFLIRFGKQKWESEFFLVLNQNDISIGLYVNNEKGNESIFSNNINNYSELFVKYCKKYSVGKGFDIYELMKMERIGKGFLPEKDWPNLVKINHFLIRKTYTKDKKILFSKRFIMEIFKVYNQLYPLYLFAASINLEKDLKDYDENVGLFKFTS
jgi:uncharacterized protein (TIGR02453 family)